MRSNYLLLLDDGARSISTFIDEDSALPSTTPTIGFPPLSVAVAAPAVPIANSWLVKVPEARHGDDVELWSNAPLTL
jgi:hypothetical protein